jgi:hypothetical protein
MGAMDVAYIIVFNKNEEFTFNLSQEQFTELEKTKINAIKTYLETGNNSNLILPKTTYSDDNSILDAIKLNLINNVDEIKNSDSNLITKKQPSNPISSIVAHDSSTPTPYIITIGGIDYNLQLKQDEFTEEEKNNTIKTYLETGNNSNLILPKATYSDSDDILNAIKLKLVSDIEGISKSDSHLINKKDSTIDEVALHGQPPTQYIIVIGEHELTLNLNQESGS